MFLEQGIAAYIFMSPYLIAPGAYLCMFIMTRSSLMSDYRMSFLDKIMLICPLLMLAGLVLHIGGLPDISYFPLYFNSVGRSPFSNFMALSSIFLAMSFLYGLVSSIKALSHFARSIILFVLAVAGYVNIFFMGFVFQVPTIVSWNTPATFIFLLGIATLGGWSLFSVVACISSVFSDAIASPFKVPYRMIAYISIGASVLGLTIITSLGAFAFIDKASYGIPFDFSPGVMLNFVGAIFAYFLGGYSMHLATKTQLPFVFSALSLVLVATGMTMGIYVFETLFVSSGIAP